MSVPYRKFYVALSIFLYNIAIFIDSIGILFPADKYSMFFPEFSQIMWSVYL